MRLVVLLIVAAILAALPAGCSSTRLEAGSGGEAHAYASTSVVLVTYEGGLHARIVETATGATLEEVKLDGIGEKAWRRKGLLSLKWEPMDPAEARKLLGLGASTTPAAPTPTTYLPSDANDRRGRSPAPPDGLRHVRSGSEAHLVGRLRSRAFVHSNLGVHRHGLAL